MGPVYDDIVEELLSLLKPGFGGRPDPDLVSRVERLSGELIRLAESRGYIAEKARGLCEWVSIACSTARHRQLGLEKVEQAAYQAAYRLRMAKTLHSRA